MTEEVLVDEKVLTNREAKRRDQIKIQLQEKRYQKLTYNNDTYP